MKSTVTFVISGEFSPSRLLSALGISDKGADVEFFGGEAKLIYKKSFTHTDDPEECVSDMLYETLLPLIPAEDKLGELKEKLHIRYSLNIDSIPKYSLLILDGKISGFFSRAHAVRDVQYFIF